MDRNEIGIISYLQQESESVYFPECQTILLKDHTIVIWLAAESEHSGH